MKPRLRAGPDRGRSRTVPAANPPAAKRLKPRTMPQADVRDGRAEAIPVEDAWADGVTVAQASADLARRTESNAASLEETAAGVGFLVSAALLAALCVALTYRPESRALVGAAVVLGVAFVVWQRRARFPMVPRRVAVGTCTRRRR